MQEQAPVMRRRGQPCRLLNIFVADIAHAARADSDKFDSSCGSCSTLFTERNI